MTGLISFLTRSLRDISPGSPLERRLDVRLFKPKLNEKERDEINKVFQAYKKRVE